MLIGAEAEFADLCRRSPARLFRPSSLHEGASRTFIEREVPYLVSTLSLDGRTWRCMYDRSTGAVAGAVAVPERPSRWELRPTAGAVVVGCDTSDFGLDVNGLYGVITYAAGDLIWREQWPQLGPPFGLAPRAPAPRVIVSRDSGDALYREERLQVDGGFVTIRHTLAVSEQGVVQCTVELENRGLDPTDFEWCEVAVEAHGHDNQRVRFKMRGHRGTEYALDDPPPLLMEAEHQASAFFPTEADAYEEPVSEVVSENLVLKFSWSGAADVRFGSRWIPIVRWKVPSLSPGEAAVISRYSYTVDRICRESKGGAGSFATVRGGPR